MEELVSTSELHRTQVNLDGLLEVLSKNLYSSPVVAVRELIQNSHDACIRRQMESPDSFVARIHLRTDLNKNQLTIEDTGAGLTKQEIIDYLATIGSGYTRQLRNQTQTEEMIGYYGLGFLTTYVVSEKVEVYTCSYQSADLSWKFISNDGKRFAIEKAKARDIGSKVVLTLDDDFSDLAHSDVLLSVLQRYCCLLPIDIFLDDYEEPINHLKAPWKLENEQLSKLRLRKVRLEFAGLFEPTFEPLCTIPVVETDDVKFNGLVWIHDGASYSTTDNRSVTVFIRDMFITDYARDLLPHWAGFASCVIDSNVLLPTASREDVQQDEHYEAIKLQIHEQLISGLIQLMNSEPEAFQRVLFRHGEQLLGAAISDERLFSALCEKLKIPTSEGDLVLGEILAQSGRQFNITMEEQGGYELILSRALKTPVIYGYRYGAFPFCKQYAELRNIEIAILGTQEGNQKLFKRTELTEEQFKLLSELLAHEGEEVVGAKFSPDYVPLLMVPDEDVLLKKQIESDDANKRISSAALSLAKNFTEKIDDEIHAYIYVNMSSPLVQRLLTAGESIRTELALMMRAFMMSLGRNDQTFGPHSLADELQKYSQSLISLIDKLEE